MIHSRMVGNTEIRDMKKKVGRPTGVVQTHQLQTRVSVEFLAKLDEWRRTQLDLPSRTEAIRRIVERVIDGESGAKPPPRGRPGKSGKT
jgi:hypothetical protein